MKIGIDIDGVLNDVGSWHYTYGFKFCLENNIDRGFDPHKYLIEEQFNLTKTENIKFWKEYIFNLMISIPAREYASLIIQELHNMGHTIIILSARDNRYLTNKYTNTMNFYVEEWLEKNNIYYDKLITGPGNKAKKCKENNIDIMIEDKESNVIEISKNIPVICFDAPYNKQASNKNITRVYSWYQIYKYFKDHKLNKIK